MSDEADADDKIAAVDAVEQPAPAQKGGRTSLWPWPRRKLQSARTLSIDAGSDVASLSPAGPDRIHTRWLPIVSGAGAASSSSSRPRRPDQPIRDPARDLRPGDRLVRGHALIAISDPLRYIKTEGSDASGDIVETQPNPPLLEAGIAISLALGVIANAALILRFLERRCYESTIVACIALTLHDCLNTAMLVAFGVIHAVDDGFTYGQPYWMTVASTACSLSCNVTLIVDFVRTRDFRRHGSGLTEKQRQLVIAVMVLLIYIALGSLVQRYLIDISFEDALYFVCVRIDQSAPLSLAVSSASPPVCSGDVGLS